MKNYSDGWLADGFAMCIHLVHLSSTWQEPCYVVPMGRCLYEVGISVPEQGGEVPKPVPQIPGDWDVNIRAKNLPGL